MYHCTLPYCNVKNEVSKYSSTSALRKNSHCFFFLDDNISFSSFFFLLIQVKSEGKKKRLLSGQIIITINDLIGSSLHNQWQHFMTFLWITATSLRSFGYIQLMISQTSLFFFLLGNPQGTDRIIKKGNWIISDINKRNKLSKSMCSFQAHFLLILLSQGYTSEYVIGFFLSLQILYSSKGYLYFYRLS